jgi:hypothetical protein
LMKHKSSTGPRPRALNGGDGVSIDNPIPAVFELGEGS